MRKLILYSVLTLGVYFAKAQNPSYNQVVSIIQSKFPGLDLSQKVIAFNVWSAGNNESREANKQYDKVFYTWEMAKVKNGAKGVMVISCCVDDQITMDITLVKDGIKKTINVNKNDFAFLSGSTAGSNVVYDSNTNKVFENLSSDKVFTSFTQLNTR